MLAPRPLFVRSLAVLALFACLALPARPASAATCVPTSCPLAFHGITFESRPTGSTVEGLGAVDPDLNIKSVAWSLGTTCPVGIAAVIEEGNASPFDAYGSGGAGSNPCLDGTKGFADPAGCVLDYDFTFAPGVTVGCFSIRILDYGDYFPFGGTVHTVTLTAFDGTNAVVNSTQLVVNGGVDATGDACSNQPGSPGNTLLTVAGTGIKKVTLRYDAFPDPNVGYDDIAFCETNSPVSSQHRSWGTLKIIAR